jgi:hypothetical protein
MARQGSFDPTDYPQGWFDESAVAAGWFADDLIAEAGSVAHAIVGAILLTVIPAATLDVTRHYGIVGTATVQVTPAASLMDVTRHYGLVGGLTVTVTPAATLDFTRHAGIVGAVPVTITPAATLDFTRHAGLVGAVPVTVTPAASLLYTAAGPPGIVGQVTVTITPAAEMLGPVVQTVGNMARWQALQQRAKQHSIVGDITVKVTPEAVLWFTRSPIERWIWGDVTVQVTPFAHELDYTLDLAPYQERPVAVRRKAVRAVPVAPAASRAYSVVGDIAVGIAPAATMGQAVAKTAITSVTVATQTPPATGPADVPVTGSESSLVGAVAVSIVPDASMRYTPAPFTPDEPWTPEQDTSDDDAELFAIAYDFLMRR